MLSKRERIISLVTGGVLGFLALDYVALSPLLDRRSRVEAAESTATVAHARAEQLIDNAPRMNARWKSMIDAGLKSEVTEAESQALRALHDWAQDAGLTLLSLQPDRVQRAGGSGAQQQQDKSFQHVTLRASGTGSMRSVSRFLWRVQTAEIPLRVTDLQVNARKEGADDLLLNVAVSTLVLSPEAPKKPAQPAPAGAARTGKTS